MSDVPWKEKDDGGPAFPCPSDDAYTRDLTGLSLRDYFAAQVLPAVWALDKHFTQQNHKELATACYAMADAMLEARKE